MPIWKFVVHPIATAILTTIRDVTARKVAENKVRQQKDFLDKMFESSATGLLLVDKSKQIVRINDSALKILDRNKNELINSKACNLFNCSMRGDQCKNLDKTKQIISDECQTFTEKGNKGTPVLKSIVKIEDGNDHFFLESFVDISERKRLEEELIYHKENLEKLVLLRTKELEDTNKKLLNAKNKAEESDRLKSAFLANMSHEIRTPMNIILGFGELLRDDNSLNTRNEYINNLNKSGRHLLELIDDVMDVSKLEAGLVNIKNSKFSIEEELKNLFLQFAVSKKCASGKVDLILENEIEGENTPIYTDNVLFRQILINLLNNAIKFTKDGSVRFGFHKVESGGSSYYKFYVKDTGIGISDSNHKIIFERFRQVDFSDKRVYGGTGLGLAICKANVSILGGEINLESLEGKGSTFSFTIPAGENMVMKL